MIGWAVAALAVVSCRAAIIITAGPEPAGHAEVQNMIQNSEQRTWCRPGQMKQIITHENCESQELQNQLCAGSCLSYSLPQTEPMNPGADSLNFCSSCQPSESHWINVTLTCMVDDTPFEEVKHVQQITNCSCATCPGFERHVPTDVSDDQAIEEDLELASDLVDRALSPQDDGVVSRTMIRHMSPSLPPSLAQLTTPENIALVLTSVTPPSSEKTPQSVGHHHRSSFGDNSVLGEVLYSESNEIGDASELEAFVNKLNLANKKNRGVSDFGVENIHPFEEENDPNVLGFHDGSNRPANVERSQGLKNTMRNLNELLRRDEYKKFSLSELKSVINSLAEPHPPSELSDKSVYKAAPQDDELVI